MNPTLKKTKIDRRLFGTLLIIMMFGHSYVLNQPQILQSQLQQIHQVSVTRLNLLYSIPSAIAIFFILPLGIMYDRCASAILLGAGFVLMLGQLVVAIFGTNQEYYAFPVLVVGRALQGTTAEVLYMIQANLSATFMGKYAGLTLILPQIGEIANVFLTQQLFLKFGVLSALIVGFITCLISFIACILLYRQLKKYNKSKMLNTYKHYHNNQNNNSLPINNTQLITEIQTQKNKKKQFIILDQIQDQKSIERIKSNIIHNNNNNNNNNKQKINQIQILEIQDQKKKLSQHNHQFTHQHYSIFKAGRIFWLVIVLCAINQCLYFPFLDNAKDSISVYPIFPPVTYTLIEVLLSIIVGEKILYKYHRHQLIFLSSLLPLIGHLIIFLASNCDKQTSYFQQFCLIVGFIFFGMGICGYYSVSMPAAGLSVPINIRGTAYACLGFFQTVTMTAVPLISGSIIEQDQTNYMRGYRDSSFLFVFLCVLASAISLYIKCFATPDSFKYGQDKIFQEESKDNHKPISNHNLQLSN